MSDIRKWRNTAGGNIDAAPDGWPEFMDKSDVNDAARENMAAVRRWAEALPWRNLVPASEVTYLSDTSIRITSADNIDYTSIFLPDTYVRIKDASTSVFGFVASRSFHSTNLTDVVITEGTAVVQATPLTIEACAMGDAAGRAAYRDLGTSAGNVVLWDSFGTAAFKAEGTGGTIDADLLDGTHLAGIQALIDASRPHYYIHGFGMRSTATTYEVEVNIGSAFAHTDPGTSDNTLFSNFGTAAFSKLATETSGWVAGDAANGLASTVTPSADLWIRVFLMVKSSDGSVEIGFDTAADAAGLVTDAGGAGWNRFRQIGWVRLNGTPNNVEPFDFDAGSNIWRYRNSEFVSSGTGDATHSLATFTPESQMLVLCNLSISGDSGNTGSVLLRHTAGTDSPSTTTDHDTWVVTNHDAAGGQEINYNSSWVMTDGSSNVRKEVTGSPDGIHLGVWGFALDRTKQ